MVHDLLDTKKTAKIFFVDHGGLCRRTSFRFLIGHLETCENSPRKYQNYGTMVLITVQCVLSSNHYSRKLLTFPLIFTGDEADCPNSKLNLSFEFRS